MVESFNKRLSGRHIGLLADVPTRDIRGQFRRVGMWFLKPRCARPDYRYTCGGILRVWLMASWMGWVWFHETGWGVVQKIDALMLY